MTEKNDEQSVLSAGNKQKLEKCRQEVIRILKERGMDVTGDRDILDLLQELERGRGLTEEQEKTFSDLLRCIQSYQGEE